MLFALVATQMFSQNNDTYVGSAYYRPIVGGLYQKGNVVGAVFYVDDVRNVMKLLCIDGYEVMGNDTWTYTNLSRNLRKYGWNLLNKKVCEEFVANMPTIQVNESPNEKLYNNKHYSFLGSFNVAMESNPNGEYVNVFNAYYTNRRYETICRYLNVVHENGTKTVEEIGGFCVTGWREVPLEPQYVTHFSR